MRSTVAVDVESDEDERVNTVAAVLESMKLTSTVSDYDLAKVFQQKLDLKDEDVALHLAKALRECILQRNAGGQTPRNSTAPSAPSLRTPVDESIPLFDDSFLSPPLIDETFVFTPDITTPNHPPYHFNSVSKDTSATSFTCATGAHKLRRKTTTPATIPPSVPPSTTTTTTFQNSTTSSTVQNSNTKSTFFVAPEEFRFHVGGMNPKKHSRLDKIRARRAKPKATVAAPTIPIPIPIPSPLNASLPYNSPFLQTATITPKIDTTSFPGDGFFSPMDIDTGTPLRVEPTVQPTIATNTKQPLPFSPTVTSTTVEFNIGVADRVTHPVKGRMRRTPAFRKKSVSAITDPTERRQQQVLQPHDISAACSHESESDAYSGHQTAHESESDAYSGHQTESTASSATGADIYVEGNRAYIKFLREEARSCYMREDYKASVLHYTMAIKVHTRETGTLQKMDDCRAVLLANRGAALMMMTAYSAAVHDCDESLKYVSDGLYLDGNLSSDGGPILKCKVLIRLGRSLVKLGQLDKATTAFDMALTTEALIRLMVTADSTYETFLSQTRMDAAMGKTEIRQCRDLLHQLNQLGMLSTDSPMAASRRNNLLALPYINTYISMSSGSTELHSMQIAILAALKRWREVAGCCERVAVQHTRFDGAFTEDIESLNPFPGISPAISLDPNFFVGDDMKVKKVSSKKAVVELVLRLPQNMLGFYIRSLRLEERYPLAFQVIASLEAHLRQNLAKSISYPWLQREKDKLERTMKLKDAGDKFYVDGKYDDALKQYSMCFKIDGEDRPDDPSSDDSNGGGRLHAVLHCNRAACYMSLAQYKEAIKDCTAALRIHTHYMKAMLRRSRCYVRLGRFDEAITEYERYIQLVSDYRKDGVYENTTCLFDGPKEVTNENWNVVKRELSEVKKSKENQEKTTRAEQTQQENRRKWYSETFGHAKAGDDAQSRRDQWYNQKGSDEPRRWDSFNGRGPHPNSHPRRGSGWQQKSESYREPHREEQRSNNTGTTRPPASPGSDTSTNHYVVLQITQSATDAEIKRGYRLMALKYHPDKNQDASASDMFRRIKLAYDVLSDPACRRQYDVENRYCRRF